MIPEIAIEALKGIGAGIAYSLTGYAKNEGESFDYEKFGATIVFGAAAGLTSMFFGFDMSMASTLLVNMGLTVAIKNVFTAIMNKITK